MSIYQGSYYRIVLTIKSNVTGGPVDITGWTLKSQIRDTATDEEYMIELTTENGGMAVINGPAGQMEIVITGDQNKNFSLGNVVGDVFRMNAPQGPVRLFGYRDKVRRSITREAA